MSAAKKPKVVILGAGPAGVGGAQRLRLQDRADVIVLEQAPVPGGNAGSFELSGMRVDFGSHRLHPACDPVILADIKTFLGDDLLDRPRHGRIGLRGRWIHFPLKPADLMLRLDPGFAIGSLRDMITKPFRNKDDADKSYGDFLKANLGKTIYDSFYSPYAWKMWGYAPTELSSIQAKRRVSASSFAKLIRKVMNSVPGFKPKGSGRFFYPRKGYGQISEAYATSAQSLGADIRYGRRVTRIVPPATPSDSWVIEAESASGAEKLEADYLWSTIPISVLSKLIGDSVPAPVQGAAAKIESRAMLLIYLTLPVEQFTEFDAHYFPSAELRITRLSEPKNYSDLRKPKGATVICAELPCALDDEWWKMTDAQLGELVAGDLARAGVPLPVKPSGVHVRRLRQAYPVYTIGYEKWFDVLDSWVATVPRLLSYGRQGLFAHDNTHHALAMAYAAAECLEPSGFNEPRWAAYREDFDKHIVED